MHNKRTFQKNVSKPGIVLMAKVFVVSLAGCADPAPGLNTASYQITRIDEGIQLSLAITGDEDGQTEFTIGDSWADEDTPHLRFKNITTGPHDFTLDGGRLVVTHPLGAELDITWELHARDGRDASQDPIYFFAPVITEDYIHLIGYSALIAPMSDAPVQVSFGGSAIDGTSSQVLSPLWKPKDSLASDRVISGFALLGNIDTAYSADGHLSVGVAKGVNISAVELVSELEPILTSISEVWGTPLIDYSVTLQPVNLENRSTLAGTAFPGGFAAAASPDIDSGRLTGFLTHEAAHEWIPNQLGRPEFEGSGREPEGYWISEGFTQMLSRKAQLKSGSIDPDGYKALINGDLRELYMSPVREFTNAQIGDMFWSHHEVERLPYLRGFLLAAKWDREINLASKGQRDMIDVLKAIEANHKASENGAILSQEIVIKYAEEMGAKTPQADIDKFIIAGKIFEPTSDMLGPDAALIETEFAPYDTGFDSDKTLETGIFTGVKENSSAYRAGLRNGMTFISKMSGGGGDTEVPLVMQVEHNGEPIEISYIPVADETVKVPQFQKRIKK